MSPRVPVPSLRRLSLSVLPSLVESMALNASKRVVAAGYEQIGGTETIRRNVEEFRDFLASQVNRDTVQEVTEAVLEGVAGAAESRRSCGKRTDDNKYLTKFMQEMFCVVEFASAAALPAVERLDLVETAKIVRSRVFELLPLFPTLKVLKLGSGSGGWNDVFRPKFLNGIFVMDRLAVFSLTYDCDDDIIKMLRKNCARTLRVLDIEHSAQVTDVGADEISQCSQLVQLHAFHTGMTPWGHAKILSKLKRLQILVRGDFLCEALEVLEQECREWEREKPQLALEEFWASEQYFFHDAEQLILVNEMCPKIRKMMFQYSREAAGSFLSLAPFSNLTELHSWGGDFYGDALDLLLAKIGQNLRTLYLIHVDELDHYAVSLISLECSNLVTLGFYNCIFRELVTNADNRDYVDRARQRRLDSVQSQPMLDLTKLFVVSECPSVYLTSLFSLALNVEHVIAGVSADVGKEELNVVRSRNRMAKLKTIKISKSSSLTLDDVYSLIEDCPDLVSIRDLESWDKVNKMDVWTLRDYIREHNYDLDIGQKEEADEKRAEARRQAIRYWSRRTHSLQGDDS